MSTSNSTEYTSDREGEFPPDPNLEENHPRRFRGTWAPVALHDAVENQKLSPSAAWLAMVIDSLSRENRGCYASNTYLGNKLGGKSDETARRLLSELEVVGFLKSKWVGKERQLWIDFNGDSEQRRSDTYKHDSENRETPEKRGVRPLKNKGLDPLNLGGRVYKRSNEEEKCETTSHTVGAAETNGVGFLGKVKSKSTELAEQFHTVILKHNKIMRRPNMGAWSHAFAELLKQRTYEQITEAIAAHDKYLEERFWPKLYAATSFCNDFVKVEDAIARYKEDDKQSEPVVVSPRAERLALTIAQELGRRSADEELEIAAQKSLDFTGHFFGKALPAVSRHFPGGENTSEFRFANALMDMFPGEEELIRTYYVKEKWRDNTPPLSDDCKWFRNWGRKLAQEYCGDAQVWDNLVDGAKME